MSIWKFLTFLLSVDVIPMTKVHALFYTSTAGKRLQVVPQNISELLTPIVLAIWLMDDGSIEHRAIDLHTQGFTPEGIQLLISALETNFGIRVP